MKKSHKCLVLGGGGFLGSHLCEALLDHGHAVRIFERPNLMSVGYDKHSSPAEWIEGDFANTKDLARCLPGCDVIFHLISTTLPQSSTENPLYDIETNLIPTINLLELARKNNTRKIIFVSSGGTVYGIPDGIPIPETHTTRPICSYGIGKLAIEKYLHLYQHLYNLDYVVLRLSNPFGERQRPTGSQGIIPVFINKILRNEAVEFWGDGNVVRDFFYVSDAVRAMLKAMSYQGDENIFNIGSGSGMSLNQVLAEIETVIGRPVSKTYTNERSIDVPINVLDISKAKQELGWEPTTPFRHGLSRTLNWVKNWLENEI